MAFLGNWLGGWWEDAASEGMDLQQGYLMEDLVPLAITCAIGMLVALMVFNYSYAVFLNFCKFAPIYGTFRLSEYYLADRIPTGLVALVWNATVAG